MVLAELAKIEFVGCVCNIQRGVSKSNSKSFAAFDFASPDGEALLPVDFAIIGALTTSRSRRCTRYM